MGFLCAYIQPSLEPYKGIFTILYNLKNLNVNCIVQSLHLCDTGKSPLLVQDGYFKVGITEDLVLDLSCHKDGVTVEQSRTPGRAMLWMEEGCK